MVVTDEETDERRGRSGTKPPTFDGTSASWIYYKKMMIWSEAD
jgi:hypothetical protein